MRRRRISATEEGDDNEIDLTPMLDVTFIMLIFFIVTTSFIQPSGITVNQPTAATAESRETSSIMIGINAQGEIWIAGEQVAMGEVKSVIARLHAESPDAAVIIQADTKAPSGVLVRVMDQVRLAGIEDMAIAAQPK